MKYLIITLLCCSTAVARAQQPAKPASPELYLRPNPDIVDTAGIKKLDEKFYIGLARQDRMPVLLPYGAGKGITNPGAGVKPMDRMPNLWNKRQPDSNTRYRSLYIRPLYHYPEEPVCALPDRKKGIAGLSAPRKKDNHSLFSPQ